MQQPFFDAETLLRVKDLPLAIKTLAQGFLQGIHASQQRGVGIEFSQFRAYEPGDELSKIDWKLFARSDKYFVREAERESDSDVWLVLDSSKSMLQQSGAQQDSTSSPHYDKHKGRWHKLDYARYLSAAIAYLAQHQGDSVGLISLSSTQQHTTQALPGSKHWQQLLLALTKIDADGNFPPIEVIQSKINAARKKGLVVIISDFHQNNDELLTLAKQLNNRYTDVVVFHLDSEDEINFNYHGLVAFEDLETGESVTVSAKDVKKGYLAAKSSVKKTLVDIMRAQNISYVNVNIDEPLDQALVAFLRARAKGR